MASIRVDMNPGSRFATDPSIPTAGLEGWYRADALSNLVDGNKVSSWTDMSGNNRDLFSSDMTVTASWPALTTNAVNGKPAVRFDGVDDNLGWLLSTPLFTPGTTLSVLIVAKKTGASDAVPRLWSFASTADAGVYDNGGTWGYYATQTDTAVDFTGSVSTNWSVISTVFASASAMTGRINGGAAVLSIDPKDTFSTSNQFAIGSHVGGASNLQCDIAEVLVYSTAVSAGNHNAAGSYLAAKYGLTWTAVS